MVGLKLDLKLLSQKPNFFDDLNLSKFLVKDHRENIQNFSALNNAIKKSKPQILFHLAAQSSVLVSYKNQMIL